MAAFVVSGFCASLLFADADTKVEQVTVPVDKCETPVLSVAINEIDCKAQSCQDSGVPSGGVAALARLISGQGKSVRC